MSSVLQGKTIVNTRAVHQAAEFDVLIQGMGAVSLAYPCIAIQPPDDSSPLDSALQKLFAGEFDWLVLTSANTVFSLAARLRYLDLSTVEDTPFKVAVVGISTAEAVTEYMNFEVDLIPDEFVAESLAQAILAEGGKRVLLPESAIARPTLAEALQAGGVDVCVVTAYQTVCGAGGIHLWEALQQQKVDVVTFTSSSTVTCCFQRLQQEGAEPDVVSLFEDVGVACIGLKTAKTATEHGLMNIIVPDVYTLSGMLTAIGQFLTHDYRKNSEM